MLKTFCIFVLSTIVLYYSLVFINTKHKEYKKGYVIQEGDVIFEEEEEWKW